MALTWPFRGLQVFVAPYACNVTLGDTLQRTVTRLAFDTVPCARTFTCTEIRLGDAACLFVLNRLHYHAAATIQARIRAYSRVVAGLAEDADALEDTGWQLLQPINGSGLHTISYTAEFASLVIVEVMADGQLVSSSPTFLRVSPAPCSAQDQVLDANGACHCRSGYTHFAGACRETTAAIAATACGATLVLVLLLLLVHRFSRGRDIAWQIPQKDLTFTDPPIKVGEGRFGPVFRATYRTTAVAVKLLVISRQSSIATSGMERSEQRRAQASTLANPPLPDAGLPVAEHGRRESISGTSISPSQTPRARAASMASVGRLRRLLQRQIYAAAPQPVARSISRQVSSSSEHLDDDDGEKEELSLGARPELILAETNVNVKDYFSNLDFNHRMKTLV